MAAGIFEKSFRMTRNSFEQLHAVLGISGILKSSDSELELYIALQDTNYRPSTTSTVRLLVFLYHVCIGSNYTVVSNKFGLGISTVSKCIHEVTYPILSHMWKAYICLPTLANTEKYVCLGTTDGNPWDCWCIGWNTYRDLKASKGRCRCLL